MIITNFQIKNFQVAKIKYCVVIHLVYPKVAKSSEKHFLTGGKGKM